MASPLSPSNAPKQPLFLRVRSHTHFIKSVSCFGIFTVGEKPQFAPLQERCPADDRQSSAPLLLWHGEPNESYLISSVTDDQQLVPVTPTALMQRANVAPHDGMLSPVKR